jgi:GGDEF domain-containing protein
VGTKSLVALDTDHIKQYVFATDRLKEIRGASSILDGLNRQEMRNVAVKFQALPIYTNGGAGLFVVDAGSAQEFKLNVQQAYRQKSQGRASITGVIQDLPEDAPDDRKVLMEYPLKYELDLMRYRLRTIKDSPPDIISLPSHPFMRPCYSCGIEYAEDVDRTGTADPDERDAVYCASCLKKREEDKDVRDSMKEYTEKRANAISASPLWDRVLGRLRNIDYDIPEGTKRPEDFNYFRNFAKAKDYLGLIYADGNSMGAEIENLKNLQEIDDFAHLIDDSIYEAVCDAIKMHLPVWKGRTEENDIIERLFPFDLLLLGGDDVVMVTSAAASMDVALTIAERFHELTKAKDPKGEGYTLSIGVILAPIKYPFGLLQDLAESALKFAKKDGARAKDGDRTRINFFKLTGGSEPDFKDVYNKLYHRKDEWEKDREFYATLRPYTVQDLQLLLNLVAKGREKNLGRTKLHQLREAVLEKNLTTSVQQGLSALLNWREKDRPYIAEQVYEFGLRAQVPRSDPRDPMKGFPHVTFPWFADGKSDEGRDVYRTSLLDFIELYDLVTREGEDSSDES